MQAVEGETHCTKLRSARQSTMTLRNKRFHSKIIPERSIASQRALDFMLQCGTAKSLSKEIPSTPRRREGSREGPEARGSPGRPRIGLRRRDQTFSGSETTWHSERSGEERRSSR